MNGVSLSEYLTVLHAPSPDNVRGTRPREQREAGEGRGCPEAASGSHRPSTIRQEDHLLQDCGGRRVTETADRETADKVSLSLRLTSITWKSNESTFIIRLL